MANNYTEFLRNFMESYILIKTETAEVFRPFYVLRQEGDANSDPLVQGIVLHESSKALKDKGFAVAATKKSFRFSVINKDFQVIAPESTGVNCSKLACYITYIPSRQFNKGWHPGGFHTTLLHGHGAGPIDFSLDQFITPPIEFDQHPEITYNCLLPRPFPSMNEALNYLNNGEGISHCITRNLALGWVKGIKDIILYHRGIQKGIQIEKNKFSVSQDLLKLKDQFKKNWGFELVFTEAKSETAGSLKQLSQEDGAKKITIDPLLRIFNQEAMGMNPRDLARIQEQQFVDLDMNIHRAALAAAENNQPPPGLQWPAAPRVQGRNRVVLNGAVPRGRN